MSSEVYDVLIIGAGPAGLTSGLYAKRAGLEVIFLGGSTPGGQVTLHYKVDNFPGFPGGITGAELMTRWLKQVIDETGAMPLPESVEQVDFSLPVKVVRTVEGGEYKARTVIIAAGSRPRRLNIPGEKEFEGRGVFYCATCDAPLLRTMSRRRAVVVGGGDSAVHTSLALLPYAEEVSILTRGSELRAKPVLIEKFRNQPKTRVLVNRRLVEIKGEKGVNGLSLVRTETNDKELMPVEAVFVGIGQTPVTDFLKGALELDEDGFIVTDPLLRTSVEGVFAAGDVRATPLRQIITAAGDGALAAHGAAQYLRTARF